MSDNHYCITTKSGLKTYFSRKKRVSKVEFYRRHPNFDERKCILIQHKEKIKKDIDILSEIKQEIEEYKEKLNKCIENENKENSKILSLKQEVTGCENRIVKYKTQIEDLSLLSQKHKNQLKNLEISNKNYNKEIEEKIKIIDSLNNDISLNKLNINDLKDSLKLFEIQNIDLRNQLKECTQYFDNFKNELSSILDIYDVSDDTELKKEILKQIEQLNEKIVISDSHKKQLEHIIKSKEEEILNLKDENKEKLEQLKNELGDVETKNTNIMQLQRQLSESNKIIEDLQSYLKEVLNSDEVNLKDEVKNDQDIKEDLKKVIDVEKVDEIYENLYNLENIVNIKDIENKEELKVVQPYEGFYDYFIKKMKKIASFGNKEIEEKVDENFKNIKQTKEVENVKKDIKKKLETSWLRKFKPVILSSAATILGAAASQSLLPTNQGLTSIQNLPKLSNISMSMSFIPPQIDAYKFEEKVDEMLKNQPKNVTEIVDKVIDSLPKKEYTPKTNFEFSDLFDIGDDSFESIRNFASTVSKYTPSITQYIPTMKDALNVFKVKEQNEQKEQKEQKENVMKLDINIPYKGKKYIKFNTYKNPNAEIKMVLNPANIDWSNHISSKFQKREWAVPSVLKFEGHIDKFLELPGLRNYINSREFNRHLTEKPNMSDEQYINLRDFRDSIVDLGYEDLIYAYGAHNINKIGDKFELIATNRDNSIAYEYSGNRNFVYINGNKIELLKWLYMTKDEKLKLLKPAYFP